MSRAGGGNRAYGGVAISRFMPFTSHQRKMALLTLLTFLVLC